mgnify:CR=1 FL=1
MAEETGGEKTLPASQHKIQKAREEGNIAKSQDLTAAFSLAIALAGIWYLGPGALKAMLEAAHFYFSNISSFDITPSTFTSFAIGSLWMTTKAVWPLILLLLVAGLTMNIIQVGFLFAPKSVAPKINRLNPLSGFKKFFSTRSAAEANSRSTNVRKADRLCTFGPRPVLSSATVPAIRPPAT